VRRGGYRSVLPEMSLSEKVTLYLELGSVYSELGNSQESAKIIQNAIIEFKGTSEEHRWELFCITFKYLIFLFIVATTTSTPPSPFMHLAIVLSVYVMKPQICLAIQSNIDGFL